MSNNLLICDGMTDYIQSPADDIESFFWVTLYAIINNTEIRSVRQQKNAEQFEMGNRMTAFDDIQSAEHGSGLFSEWVRIKARLSGAYKDVVEVFSIIAGKKGWESDEEEARYWKAAWHGYALEGVCKSLEVIFEHIAKM